jgi:GAF domain-containing protein
MGVRAAAAFREAERLAGVLGKVRLASMASVTSAEAATIEDSPAVLHRLDVALGRLRQQVTGNGEPARRETVRIAAITDSHSVDDLRRYLRTHLDLMSQRDLIFADAHKTILRVNEASGEALRVERVSVWFLEQAPSRIRCVDLFSRRERKHSSGAELTAHDHPAYFAALASERTVAANDAYNDPRTSCLGATYLRPLGITAVLDVPIWVKGNMVGLLRHEHVGSPRTWGADEESFAYVISSYVGLALGFDGKPWP